MTNSNKTCKNDKHCHKLQMHVIYDKVSQSTPPNDGVKIPHNLRSKCYYPLLIFCIPF